MAIPPGVKLPVPLGSCRIPGGLVLLLPNVPLSLIPTCTKLPVNVSGAACAAVARPKLAMPARSSFFI